MSQTTAADAVRDYLRAQASLDTLRFITCGSVDDGKSTLIGRMLYEAQLIFDDQVASLEADSRRMGTQGGDIDFALLVDGLAAEREQGITIDVAYRFFATGRRKFIVADTPGHEQYTRNMVTGASTADVAVILVDARQGILTQTRRHSMICSVLGIRHVVVAVNKMDLVGYDRGVFDSVVEDYHRFASGLGFASVTPVPVSALRGDNVVECSGLMQWYRGPTLLGFLETVDARPDGGLSPFRFPVQWVNRPSLDFRGFSGTLASGEVAPGDAVRVLPSGQTATVREVVLFDRRLDRATAGQAVTLTLDREVDVSRGDLIVSADRPCEVADHFQADLVWMDEAPGYQGRSYLLRLATATVGAQLTELKHKLNVNSFERLPATEIQVNDLCVVSLRTDRPVPFEPYKDSRTLGGFVLIDRITNRTVAAGMIGYALRRSNNIHRQRLEIDKAARESLNGHRARVVWFTGLSGSGKSTVASALEATLHARGVRTYLLDGDNVRHGLNSDLGFTEPDRVENIRRVAEVARLMADAGLVVLTAFISPFRSERQMARSLFGDGEFVEVYVDTPFELAEERDPKGLYKKARAGEIPNFTGVGSPYEPPEFPELVLRTADHGVDELVGQVLAYLDKNP